MRTNQQERERVQMVIVCVLVVVALVFSLDRNGARTSFDSHFSDPY